MKTSARTLLLLCLLCLLPPVARAQGADAAVWGVYARLLGARLQADFGELKRPYTWSWNTGRTAILEDNGRGEDDRITSLGNGRLARHINGSHRFTGSIQPDGSVVWASEGFSLTSSDHRVRIDGDAVLLELVSLKDGRVDKVRHTQQLTGVLPGPSAVASAAAPAPTEAASAIAVASDAAPEDARPAPRTLSEADIAKLRNSMARDKVLRAETLRRQQEEAVRQEQARRQRAEDEARMAAERAQQEQEERAEARRSDDAFASALMGGLNTFRNELAKGQAERAQQQAFLANLQRQQQQAAEARQREQDRQRQVAAQEQLYRQQQAAAQQPRQAGAPVAATLPRDSAAAPVAPAPSSQPSQAEIAERQLRERAAAERQRLQQAALQPRPAPAAPSPAVPAAPATTPALAEHPPKAYSAVLFHSMAKGSKSNTHPTCYSNVLRLSIPYGQSPGSVIEPLYARFVAQCTQQVDGVLRGPLTAAPGWHSDMTGDDFRSLLQGYRNWKENAQVQVAAP